MDVLVTGGHQLCHPKGLEVQSSDTDVPPVARQSAGVRSELHRQRRRRQLRAGDAHRARDAQQCVQYVQRLHAFC